MELRLSFLLSSGMPGIWRKASSGTGSNHQRFMYARWFTQWPGTAVADRRGRESRFRGLQAPDTQRLDNAEARSCRGFAIRRGAGPGGRPSGVPIRDRRRDMPAHVVWRRRVPFDGFIWSSCGRPLPLPAELVKLVRFTRIAQGIDVAPFLSELAGAAEMWLVNTSRQRKIRCQRDTQNIFLRVAKKPLPSGATNAIQLARPAGGEAAQAAIGGRESEVRGNRVHPASVWTASAAPTPAAPANTGSVWPTSRALRASP